MLHVHRVSIPNGSIKIEKKNYGDVTKIDVSIPNGSIKIRLRELALAAVGQFQFQMVRLK